MIELPKLQQTVPIVEDEGFPSLAFHRWWQEIAQTIEGQLNTLNSEVIALIAAAQATADAATADAATAQAQADQVKLDSKIATSYVIPAEVLTAADVGTTATITIFDHVRRYGDSSELSVIGGTITGCAFSTVYAVYYDDATCSDTTPSYVATTTASTALNNYVPGRHFVGLITTPADGATSNLGGSNPPGGGGTATWNRFDI